ncbi:MAG: fasciclin domain-containing protein, partial [Muribaculaceae bacterium]|nr:fasciclin domain-containing protein [Muribaculaceae bacterium]
MSKTINDISRSLVAAAALVSLGACSDNWDDHYGPDSSLVADTTVYEMIKSDPSLETFGRMIDIAGYAGLLDTSQTFTVWAPDNEALAGVDLSDEDEVRRIVANHVARFNVSTASSGDVRMYNGKVMRFDGNTFGGAELRRSDIVVRNGVMHVLASRIPYSYNIREYIDTHAETSSLSAFLRRFDENKFDEASSAPIDIDENGNTVYD